MSFAEQLNSAKSYVKQNIHVSCCLTVEPKHKQVGKANVHTALSLVGYEDEVKAAMAYVFGTAFVCNSMDNAKKVLYKTF